jgi:hypothetical protein
MARIIPDGWREIASVASAAALPASAQRHRETLELLARGLPDDYTVYHAVHWTTVERGFSVFGEMDFAVVNRQGDVLLIEQKTGFLEEGTEGLLKRERGRIRNVPVQIARTVAALRDKLARRPGCESIRIDYLLYCPDYAVRRAESAGLSADRLVDASRRDRLVPAIRDALPPGRPGPSGGHPPAWHQVDRFFRDVIELETDVNALVGQAQALVTRISGGLAHWARQLVCYNRPLADHFAAVVPPGGEVCTFHTLCQRLLRDAGRSVDLSVPDGFERLEREAASVPVDARWLFDTVVVDEGQDFPVAWRDQVLRHAKPDARVIWLEDAMQALYQREPAPLPGWVTLHARANYRSPREVVRLLTALLPPHVEIEAAGPLAEAGLEIIEYTDTEGLLAGTKEAIRKCLGEGFRRHDIAVVSFRGREGSALLGLDHLGPHPIRRFTGRYDLLAQPVFTDGELLVESVYRFKGQAAPAVVLSEVDFDVLDERAVRKLFVGATRATMKLAIVASSRAARVLRRAVGG